MQRFVVSATSALFALVTFPALAQTRANVFGLEPGEHAVGFRLLEDEDLSRTVTGGARGAAHPRPIRTYLWYPAAAARRAAPLTFDRYAALADGDIWPADIAGELRERLEYANGPLARSLSATSYEALLERPMRAVEDAAPLNDPAPAKADAPAVTIAEAASPAFHAAAAAGGARISGTAASISAAAAA